MNLIELKQDEFHTFQEFIYRNSGIRIPEKKLSMLSGRIRRRLKACKMDKFQSYYRFLNSPQGRSELKDFLNVITTNETFFFRTEKHFEWFQKDFISEITGQARNGERQQKLRVWSAACSTGEEPYSIGMCLLKNQLHFQEWSLKIIGTDISEDVLTSAHEGIYNQRSLEAVEDKLLRRYFSKMKDESLWQAKSSLKDIVEFHRHNLMEPMKLPPFDCIFIRNVLIYFDAASKQKVVKNLINALTDGGYLVVGPSEGIYDMLGSLKKHSTFLYQKVNEK
ncbi:MAG: CheR family methyltransferase [Pirellulales bacterium]